MIRLDNIACQVWLKSDFTPFRVFVHDDAGKYIIQVLLDFSLTVKAVPHECVIRTSHP